MLIIYTDSSIGTIGPQVDSRIIETRDADYAVKTYNAPLPVTNVETASNAVVDL